MEQTPILYTQEVVSRLIGKSVKTLERWRRDGEGPAWIKVGKTPRYEANTLCIWMLRNEVAPHKEGDPIVD